MALSDMVLAACGSVLSGAILKIWADVSQLKVAMAAQQAIVPRIENRLQEIVNELKELRKELVREYDSKR